MQFTWVFDDHGIPQNYRVMDGFGVHTFVLANKEGKQTYVKFTWKNNQGGESLERCAEGVQVALAPVQGSWKKLRHLVLHVCLCDIFDSLTV